ncbi:MAG: MCP four helix bundle domain-containing protein, partial [Methylococcales bacterium]|nr:MCP four helix bundle domain-containing protein [Methylococcales bacterium]
MFNNLSIRSRLILIISSLSILAIVLSGIGLVGIHYSNNGLQSIYKDRLMPVSQLSEIRTLQLTSRLKVNAGFVFDSAEENEKNTLEIKENMAKAASLWKDYTATILTPEEKILAEKFS